LIRADAQNVVGESLETNNVMIRAVQVGPDLVVSALSAPNTVAAGGSFTVTDTTRNLGGGPAVSSVTTFYFSANSALDAADVVLGSRVIPALDGGMSDAGTVTLSVPAGTLPGTYYLFARADSDAAVAESQEFNNLALRVIQVTAGN
jgi:subtilase family serine protease